VPLYLFGVYLGCRAPVNAGRIKTAGNSLPPVSIVSPLSHPVYFTVQACAGLPTLTVTAINRMARVDSPTVVTDLGVILTSAVGALNFILVIYVLCGAAKDG
jgi:hypothetical protein